jgi:hypothetical protein
MLNWHVQADAIAKAQPRDIWRIWTDVSNWPTWDQELEWSFISGPFKVGAKGKLKPKGWLASSFRIISVENEKSHSDITIMPLTEIVFKHWLEPYGDSKTRIYHRVEVNGFLAPLLWLTMRRTLKKGMPLAVQKLAVLAEAKKRML